MDAGEALRRYLQTRRSLGEPEVVFPALDRRGARRMTRRLAIEGILGPAREAEADRDAGRAASQRTATPEPSAADPAPDEAPAAQRAADAPPAASLSDHEIGRLAREGTGEEIRRVPDLASLRRVVEACERCPLHRSRTRDVFGEGDPHARVVCVGEAPGAREDETGRPFVGPAGQLLDRLLLAVGFRREEVYICNVLKSRPPSNRDPQPDEIEACSPYLHRQLELIDPDVVVAFGAFAARTLLDATGSLGSLRGEVHRYRGYPLVATYHPAALLRNRSWTRPTWEDLQRVRAIVDGERAGGESGIQAGQQMGLI